ncbi:hypothetical protein BJX65DRAFT_300482 [Aspergillus insuetus]
MAERKRYLDADDFNQGFQGLRALDRQTGYNTWLTAFAPIRLVSAGGFLAVTYFKNRDSTGEIDYLIEPEFAQGQDIQSALREAVTSVAEQLAYNDGWINEAMAIFNIILFKGENLEILAAPLEWSLERKLRRIYTGNQDRKAQLDMADTVALLKQLREK